MWQGWIISYLYYTVQPASLLQWLLLHVPFLYKALLILSHYWLSGTAFFIDLTFAKNPIGKICLDSERFTLLNYAYVVCSYVYLCLCFSTPNSDHPNFLFTFGEKRTQRSVKSKI